MELEACLGSEGQAEQSRQVGGRGGLEARAPRRPTGVSRLTTQT